jgi:hypothetical protein
MSQHLGQSGQDIRPHVADGLGANFANLPILIIKRPDENRERLAREPSKPGQVLRRAEAVWGRAAPQPAEEIREWVIGNGGGRRMRVGHQGGPARADPQFAALQKTFHWNHLET